MRGLSLCLLLICAVGVGCKKTTTAPLNVRVTRVVISSPDLDDENGADPGDKSKPMLQEHKLYAAALRGLSRAGVPVVPESVEPHLGDFQLRLQVHSQEGPLKPPPAAPLPNDIADHQHRLRVVCAGLLSAHGPVRSGASSDESPPPAEPELQKLEQVGLTEKDFPREPTAAEITALIERLVEDNAQTLGAELQLLGTDSRALIARIGKEEGDVELRKTAIQILGQRKERLAVPVLIGLLKPKDSEPEAAAAATSTQATERIIAYRMLRDVAIGALVEIGDQRAVRPLLDSVAFRDHAEMGKIVEAVGSIGGDEARRYLQFVQSSHPEPAIRTEAESALHRLDGRSAAVSEKPSSP